MSFINMNTSIKTIFVVLGITFVIACFGLNYPHQSIVAGSPVGSTFNDSKQVAVNISPLTSDATSTSILNTDGSARWVADFGFVGCTGIGSSFTYPNNTGTGLANLLVQAATTSASGIALGGNTNLFLNMTVPTSSALYIQNSTSTVPVQAGYWAAGSYLTFTFNATSTGACVVEVDYVPS